ncbi:hypothetical protein [Psychroserpens algicola]|uniref:Calcium-binding protein n=1 Tax=Psychroserpens algicola TaxID=1719034 RepID=A0ABT0H692_9FLAO|nr:hypothetical protein [Psychroserpens algicola]MCK8479896.1 hypothetical protein [Psychroserpens algicola]
MRQFFYICVLGLLALSCDDGDVFTVDLEFDEVLERCGDDDSDSYVLYDSKTDPNESLSLIFPVNDATRAIFNPEFSGDTVELTINENTIRFNYRTYDGDPEDLLCQEIPEPGTSIVNDYEAGSGAQAIFVSTFEDDDNDGIPSEYEGRGAQAEDGTYPDAQDTDGDGLADYIDEDDDNDNILTSAENPNFDEDTELDNALDSDGDGIANYLDNDDDDDGVLTRNEDTDDVGISPLNDFDESGGVNNVPRYLDPMATDEFIQNESLETDYTRTISVYVTIINANIEILNTDEIILGTYTLSFTLPEDDD